MKTATLAFFVTTSLLTALIAATPQAGAALKTFECGQWSLTVDTADGSATLSLDNRPVAVGVGAEWGLDSVVATMKGMKNITASSRPFADKFGNGMKVAVAGRDGKLTATRTFRLYEGKPYAIADLTVANPAGVEANYMAPVACASTFEAFSRPGNSTVFVPYDNDAWVRYSITPFGESMPVSYEVSAILNADTREAIVVGSMEHDVWKTGVRTVAKGATAIDSLYAFGGVATNLTRDIRPHGAVKGKSVKSPAIMLGRFDDWRDGMETYADLCAIEAPRIQSAGPRPFGWNSWGKLQTRVNFENANQVGEFIAEKLEPESFVNADSTVYIGLDAFWDFGLTEQQRIDFAKACHDRGQKAGIYFCPFTDWGKNPEATVGEAPEYKYKDIYLRHGDKILEFDGAYAIDPTHPATRARIARQVQQFIDWGYDFMKIDFMAHGAYEADSHYDPSVTTGVQAYNSGMAFIDSVAQGKLWINLSIAPLFPANYAHSRRIGCDAWADINNTEYSLNALTYGWWLDHVYHYNDADHIVMEGVTDGENRARLTSSAITGLFLLGDDLSEVSGKPATRAKVLRTAANPDINAIARACKSFRPVEPGKGDRAADMFVGRDGDTMYVAIFNFSDRSERKHLPLHRLGLSDGADYQAVELWSHDASTLRGAIDTEVPAKDVKVYRIAL